VGKLREVPPISLKPARLTVRLFIEFGNLFPVIFHQKSDHFGNQHGKNDFKRIDVKQLKQGSSDQAKTGILGF